MRPGTRTPLALAAACFSAAAATGRLAAMAGRASRPVESQTAVPVFGDDFGRGLRHRGGVPPAEALLWQSEDGHLGLRMAGCADAPVPFPITIGPAQFGLKGGRRQVAGITPESAPARPGKARSRYLSPVQQERSV